MRRYPAWKRVLLVVCDYGAIQCDDAASTAGVKWSTTKTVLSEAKRYGALDRDGSVYTSKLSRAEIMQLARFYDLRDSAKHKRADAIRDAERHAVETGLVYVINLDDACDDHGYDEHVAALRTLRRLREETGDGE